MKENFTLNLLQICLDPPILGVTIGPHSISPPPPPPPISLSTGGTTFSPKFLKGGDQKKSKCQGGLKESLPQIFAWGELTMFLVKKDCKMKYGFKG